PIPAFYCCYLLRSKNHKSYYIGSTPNPARRLRQHNGEAKGGAKKTSIGDNRPWEMACIVTGFPSRFAALQFEWAWQHTHETRHIEKDVREARIEGMRKKNKKATVSPKKKRRQKPPTSLKARLENLHHLLGVKSFRRWPLSITFFSPDIFRSWEGYSQKMEVELRKGVPVHFVDSEGDVSRTEDLAQKVPEAIRNISVAYEDCKGHVEKAGFLIDSGRTLWCAVCREKIQQASDLFLVCPLQGCQAVSHLTCLSREFLKEENNHDALIPIEGTCPGCRTKLPWVTLMKELSLRVRGEKEIEALFKPKRRKKQAVERASQPLGEQEKENEGNEGNEGNEDEELDDDWTFRVDEDDD
ncbi:structure-specific endonuclease subunit SLX1, partial [Delitschia confertaspora ATCC 74209]